MHNFFPVQGTVLQMLNSYRVKPDQHAWQVATSWCLSQSYFDIKIIFHKYVTLDTMAKRSIQKEKSLYKMQSGKKKGFLISWKMYSGKEEEISDREIVFLSELSRGKSIQANEFSVNEGKFNKLWFFDYFALCMKTNSEPSVDLTIRKYKVISYFSIVNQFIHTHKLRGHQTACQ